MWDVRACRCCLNTKGKLDKIEGASRRIYAAVTGFNIQNSDGMPAYFCVDCNAQIRKILMFRRRSRRAYFVLKEIITVKKQITFNDISSVDKTKTNLQSRYGYCKPQNIAVYSVTAPDSIDDIDNTNAVSFDLCHPGKAEHYTNEAITKHTPEIIKDTIIVTDIKPHVKEEVEPKNEVYKAERDETGDDYNNNDANCNNEDAIDAGNIDLEDVFKDLYEEVIVDDDDEIASEHEPIKMARTSASYKNDRKNKEKEREKERDLWDRDFLIPYYNEFEACKALAMSTIKVLNETEQLEGFMQRLQTEPFQSALKKCAMCVTTFSTVDALTLHIRKHDSAEFKHMCKICKIRFPTERMLFIHHNENHLYEYTCNFCNRKSYALVDIIQCYYEHESRTPKLCPSSSFTDAFIIKPLSPRKMIKSIKWSTKFGIHVCRKCHLSFTKKSDLETHQLTHIEPLIITKECQCDICKTWHGNVYLLARHMTVWHLYSYKCKDCRKVLMTRRNARNHKCSPQMCSICGKICSKMWVHRKKYHPELFNYCNLCNAAFISVERLYNHQFRQHGYFNANDPMIGDPNYRCEICNVQFMTESAYKSHVVTLGHEEADNIEFACRVCRKLYSNQKEYDDHKVNCKKSKFPRPCPLCEKILYTAKTGRHHFRTMHPESRMPFAVTTGDYHLCEICGKSVHKSDKTHMKRHKAGVEESRHRTCNFCPTKLYSAKAYTIHVIRNHTRKPYVCTQCSLRFKDRCECRDHILKTHAPGLFYHCERCDRQFSHLDYLNKHSVKSHGVNLKKTCKDQYFTKRMKGKLYVYPHMKIDGSHVDIDALKTVQVELCDYLEKTNVVVDYKLHFVFDPCADPILPDDKPQKKVKKKLSSENLIKTDNFDNDDTPAKKRKLVMKNYIDNEEEMSNNMEYEEDETTNISFEDKTSDNIEYEEDIEYDNVEYEEESSNNIGIEEETDAVMKSDETDFIQEQEVLEDEEIVIEEGVTEIDSDLVVNNVKRVVVIRNEMPVQNLVMISGKLLGGQDIEN